MRTPDYTDGQLLEGLRAAAADAGEPLTNSAYDAWQRAHGDAASPTLVIRRFGSWRAACEAAGVRANTTRSTSRRWTDDDLVAAVAAYLQEAGGGSYAGYTAWAATQENAPSGPTLRQRGAWSDFKARAQAR